MTKKVLFLITKGNFGGAQRYVFDLATSLPHDGFEIVVATGEEGVLNQKLSEAHIRVITIPELRRDVRWLSDPTAVLFSIIRVLKVERPDILHLNSNKAGGIGAFAGRLVGIKRIIFTAHGFAFNEDRSFVSKMVIKFATWLTIILAHKTIAVAKKIKDQVVHWPFAQNKIIVVHNGISYTEFLTKDNARDAIANNISERIIIGTISELHKNKGLDFLIRGFALLNQIRSDAALVIIGGGEEQDNLEALINKLGIKNKVHLLGFKKDAAQYLKAFDIFTLTSRTEAFPYVPLEAGLAKLPIIATSVGGIPEIIDNKINGILIPPRKPAEIERGLRFLIENPEIASSYGGSIKDKIEKEFNLETMLKKTIEIYEAKT